MNEMREASGASVLSREARAHLEACPRCLRFYEERAALSRLVGELGRVAAPPDFEFRLRARMAASKSRQHRPWFRARFVPGMASIALAACFALVVAASILMRRDVTTQSAIQLTEAPAAPLPIVAEASGPDKIERPTIAALGGNSGETVAVRDRVVTLRRAGQAKFLTAGMRRLESKGRPVNSFASDFNGATVIAKKSAPSSFVDAQSTISRVSIPIRLSTEPLRVVLRDERGGVRYVSMRPVSFGAQDSVGHASVNASAARSGNEGVW